ncbi:Hpt domain-containing protein [Methylosinus sp. Sm6]|uniref:Hpt domain-containing protein n=1 Tax=Methylosinus sp. Sm6 TaxID=2866948 RepID=UPI00351CC09E
MNDRSREGDPPPASSVDFAHLAGATAGDEELAQELLALFGGQARNICVQLDAAPDDRKRRELVHTLKGSAAAIGAFAVAGAADACEAALASGGEGAPPLDALRRALAETLAAIEQHLAQRRA